MQADYISSNQFKVSTDKTEEFLAGRRVRANCDGTYIYSTIQSSTYSDPDTTVTLEEDELISSLSEVHYGIVSIGEQGSFPNHSHDGTEGTGGGLSLLTLSDTPSVYDEGKYLRSTTSGVELEDLNDYYYTESEVDTISGTLQTDINTKPDTEWFLTNGTPSNSIGKLNDVAIDQNVGDIYKMVAGTEEASETFYPVVGGDDGWRGSVSGYYSTDTRLYIGGWNEDFGSWIRFPNINILQGTVIVGAYIKFTARASNAEVTCNLNCYFNNVDNAVAPGNATAFDALALTDAVAWNGISAWTDGVQYDTPNLVSIIQNIVDRPGFSSGNAVQFVVKNNSSSNIAYRRPSSIEYESGTEKAELHITWLETVGVGAWEEKLTPDFLKLSDTPTTYSGVSGKYLKTTTSGIDFVEDLYTKSEVDTISGSLQTNIDAKPDTEVFLVEGAPSNAVGEENDIAVNQNIGTFFKKGSPGVADSGTFYIGVSGDDVAWRAGYFTHIDQMAYIGNNSGAWKSVLRFPGVTIPFGSTIDSAFVRLTAHADGGNNNS